jgi:hypothetical protein
MKIDFLSSAHTALLGGKAASHHPSGVMLRNARLTPSDGLKKDRRRRLDLSLDRVCDDWN